MQKRISRNNTNRKIQSAQDINLHGQYILFTKSAITHINEIINKWWPNLLILASNKHSRNGNKLKMLSINLLPLEISIDQINRQKQGFRFTFKLKQHLDHPIDQNAPHFLADIVLPRQVMSPDLGLFFLFYKVFYDFFSEFACVLWVADLVGGEGT